MAEHTPGPWKAVRNSVFWQVEPANRRNEDPYIIGDVCASYPGNPDTGLQEANARLIAAAPEMLAALEAVHAWLQRGEWSGERGVDNVLSQVIAAAKGGE